MLNLKIIVDAFGGDNAPVEILKGCASAVAEYGVNILLVGSKEKIMYKFAAGGGEVKRVE